MAAPLTTRQLKRLSDYILRSPALKSFVVPTAQWYARVAGYRELGLKYDDLLIEETEVMKEAIARLPPKVQEDRAFRMRRAVQLDIAKDILPSDRWTRPEDDKPYLEESLQEVEQEFEDRKFYNNLK